MTRPKKPIIKYKSRRQRELAKFYTDLDYVNSQTSVLYVHSQYVSNTFTVS